MPVAEELAVGKPRFAPRARVAPDLSHPAMTVNLDAGSIEHVVNDTGARVDSTAPGVPSYVVDYPAP